MTPQDKVDLSDLSALQLDAIIKKRKVLVVAGTGGVGKTTVSSALGIRAAISGRKVVVVTIDPAKRLATSLGLESLGLDTPQDLTDALNLHLKQQGKPLCLGQFSALIPDTKKTFESFVAALAPTAEIQEQVVRNPIYQIFAKEFAGTNEYMALKKLHALVRRAEFDLIILDTPPSRNALSFLEAPTLLSRFFEERFVRWLVVPANRILSIGMKKSLSVLEKLTGGGFMTHLVDFATTLFEVQTRFTETLSEVTELLKSEDVGFCLVSGPTPDTLSELEVFSKTLTAKEMRFDVALINRCLSYLKSQPVSPSFFASPAGQLTLQICARETQALRAFNSFASFSGVSRQTAEKRSSEKPLLLTLPELSRDVHSIEDLIHVADAFIAPSADGEISL